MSGRPWRLHPSSARFVASPRIGYASRPNRAIDGRGLSPPRSAALLAATDSLPTGTTTRLAARPRLMRTTRPLIPRRILFDNPTFFGAKISPDGRWISWLAPVDKVLNVWLAPVGDINAGVPVTRTKGRPINW